MRVSSLQKLRAAFFFAACFAAAGAASADALSRADYTAHKRQIDADLTADRVRCRQRTGRDLSLCVAQAQGRHRVAMAELDFNASGTDADAARLDVVKRDSEFVVARERCEALGRGPERERCLARAEAAHSGAAGPLRAPPLRKY